MEKRKDLENDKKFLLEVEKIFSDTKKLYEEKEKIL